MRNTLKHLTLLTRMKDDGLLPALTGSFSEDAIAQACGQVETLQLQERLHIRKTKRIQEELIRVPNFAALYGVLCRQEIGDEEIASVLESADGYGEKLTAYPQEQVLAVMKPLIEHGGGCCPFRNRTGQSWSFKAGKISRL